MSENLELVRSIYADWQRGDSCSVEWAHPQIDYVFADGGTPGRWTAILSTFRDDHITKLERFSDHGEGLDAAGLER